MDTSENLLRAFISSDTGEFERARPAIASILQKHRVKPVYWEKLEKPSPESLREFYLKNMGTCQLYIGIFGTENSPGTEDEYREAVATGLERLIFIKNAPARGSQIQQLIQLAEKDVVREKFTTDQDLQTKIDERLQNWLSQTAREYLELKKQRTYAFLQDYRTRFLEPLLEQVQLIRTQLQTRKSIQFSGYWRPDQITNHPYYQIDPQLKTALDAFFAAFTKCELSTAPAARNFEHNCNWAANFHLEDHIKAPDVRKKVCSRNFDCGMGFDPSQNSCPCCTVGKSLLSASWMYEDTGSSKSRW